MLTNTQQIRNLTQNVSILRKANAF